jgi:hypothetical protein
MSIMTGGLVPSRNRLGSGVAALAIVVAAGAAGCSSSGPAAAKPGASAAPKLTAAQMLDAAIGKSQQVNSFAATMNMQITAQGQAVTMSGTMRDQTRPSGLVEIDASKLESGGQNVGPMSEIIDKQGFYLKLPLMAKAIQQEMHTSKPWFEIPMSAVGSGTFSQILSQAQTTNPLSATQVLSGATDTRKVGTGVIDGVPVTELSGSESTTAALAKLPASVRTQTGQQIEKLGMGEITFKVWVDGQNTVRKEIITEAGSTTTLTMTSTVTSINQPVSITVPPSSQVTQLPASALSGTGM